MFHSRTQRAIGQGGFHSASLDDGASVFRYAYDCGSNDARRLAAAIRDLHDEGDTLDVLFLSHLDQDHANGCDALRDALDVETVVLPYLSPFERVVLVAEVAAAQPGGTSTVTTVDILSRPAAWFLERGVKRVVFIRGRRQGDADPQSAQPPDQPPPDDAAMTLTKSAAEHPEADERAALGARGRDAGDDVLTAPSAPMWITKANVPIWELTPFVHPEPLRVPAFQNAVARLLGIRRMPLHDDPTWMSKVKAAVSDRSTRSDLAKLYNEHIRRDRNLSSMTLYSGPVAPAAAGLTLGYFDPYYDPHPAVRPLDHARPGWMGTGDAHLDREIRRGPFEQFYGARLAKTGTFMLPHHGSRHNLRPTFIQSHPGTTWVAAYGNDNTYHHPSKHLMQVASAYGRAVRVTERRNTELVQSFALEW